MRLFQLMLGTLFAVAMTLTANAGWANEDFKLENNTTENLTGEDITIEGSSLQGIDSSNSANGFWGIDERNNGAIALPSSPTITIERDDSSNFILDLLNQEPKDDQQEKLKEELNSNYGDVPSRGGAVPFLDF